MPVQQSTLTLLLVAAGGALGSAARYIASLAVLKAVGPTYPAGTLVVNLCGCLLIGLAAGVAEARGGLGTHLRAFLVVGILGGFTTFSAFGFETYELIRESRLVAAAANASLQVLLGVAAVAAGASVGRLL